MTSFRPLSVFASACRWARPVERVRSRRTAAIGRLSRRRSFSSFCPVSFLHPYFNAQATERFACALTANTSINQQENYQFPVELLFTLTTTAFDTAGIQSGVPRNF